MVRLYTSGGGKVEIDGTVFAPVKGILRANTQPNSTIAFSIVNLLSPTSRAYTEFRDNDNNSFASASDVINYVAENFKTASGDSGGLQESDVFDGNGKVKTSLLPNSVMELKGEYNAATNTPTLVNGTGNSGDVWEVTTPGTVDFGDGAKTFALGDWVVYAGDKWHKSPNTNPEVTWAQVTGKPNLIEKGQVKPSDLGLTLAGQVGVRSGGGDTWFNYPVTATATINTIPVRTSSGAIKVALAVNADEAARLDQVISNTSFFYLSQNLTSDAVNDIRLSNNAGALKVEKCTVANAVKGAGTWVVV